MDRFVRFSSARRRRALGCAAALVLSMLPARAATAQHIEPLPPVTLQARQPAEGLPTLAPQQPAEPVFSAVSPLDAPGAAGGYPDDMMYDEQWASHWLPGSIIWHSYMAGTREPGFRSVWSTLKDGTRVWDVTLGGRVGIWRYGNSSNTRPEGWQLDFEGAAMPRLDPVSESTDLISVDYRVGILQTYGNGPFQAKFGYYHLSSHLGDEFMINNPSVVRINYVRDSAILGLGYYVTEATRIYGEVAYAFGHEDGAEPLELQYGVEYSPIRRDGRVWAPFWAVNGHSRQELNMGGDFVLQAGVQIRNGLSARRFRLGAQYYNGHSEQGEFFAEDERKWGFGLWYDY